MEEFTILPSYVKERTDSNHFIHTIGPYKFLGDLVTSNFNYYSINDIFEKIFLFLLDLLTVKLNLITDLINSLK